ncbi:GMC family oxidoreductase [Novosphingobium sp.]|uniref:GMC family oxidoreductase n=1 Tax=Novosphingobium sp. TaxID=1874826 RepID=UPI00333E79AE
MSHNQAHSPTRHARVDAVIVGAGAAGNVFAAVLAEAGKSVLVLDPGPAWKPADLYSSAIWSRRLRWGGPPVESTGANAFGAGFNAGWGTGGAALHHYGTWPRLMPADFTMQSDHGKGLDWPIGYDDLRPFYDRVQTEVGVSGDAVAEIWRPAGEPYPLPPLQQFAQARLLAKCFHASGMKTAPSPMAILSQDYKGRPACLYDGWCDAGCPIGALANPLVTYHPRAIKAGAKFVNHAHVTRLLPGKTARVAAGVDYVDAAGTTHTVLADMVILAASTISNPTILLNSTGGDWHLGAGNSSGLVGRYFMTHSITSVYGFFDDEETENYLGVTGAQATNMDHYGKLSLGDGAFGSLQWQLAPTMKPNDLLGVAMARADLFGADLTRFMERAVHHLAVMFGFGEGLPLLDNRVELSDRVGPGGTRTPRVVHAFAPESIRLSQNAAKLGLKIVASGGASEPWAGPMANAHMMGGTIMGTDPHRSVTDSFGRSHDIGNLIIAGPGLYPTAGAMNPNFTNHALALRNAEHAVSRWLS